MSSKSHKHFPSSYGMFCAKKANHHRKGVIKGLNRFCARYRLAHSFSGITLDTYSAKTTRIYGSMFGMFLAYTAYEALLPAARQLGAVLSERTEENVVLDEKLSKKLRANIHMRDFLLEHTRDSDLKLKLKSFYKGNFHDITCVGYAVRNTFSHGDLLTSDIGSGLASDRKLLDEMAAVLMAYCDEVFSKCARRL
jgi:hypothetical protein